MHATPRPSSLRLLLQLWLLLALALPGAARASDAHFWVETLSAVEEQRFADVVGLLKPVAPSVRGARGDLLLALALASEGEPAEALDALPAEADVARWPEAVREDVADRRVQWAARAGRCDVLDGLDARTPSLRVAAARCAIGRGEYDEALTLLRRVSRVDAAELRAQAHAEAGRPDASLAEVRSLYLEHPASGHAPRWLARLEEAGPVRWSTAERMQRAEGFVSARKFNTAVDELKDVSASNRSQGAALWHLRGMAMFRSRVRYAEAARALERAVRLGSSSQASDAFHAARAHSRAGANERAIRDYRRFAKRYPDSSLVPEALFLAAWLESREGRPKAAWRALTRLARDPRLAGSASLREKVLWELGFLSRAQGAHGRAADELARYGEVARDAMERARGHYWAADSLARLRRTEQALAELTLACHADPLGYYAVLARRKARALGAQPPRPFPQPADAEAFPQPKVELPEAARFYASLALTDLAADALGRMRGLETGERVAMLLETGLPEPAHRSAHALSRELLLRPVSDTNRWLWRALYPTPFAQSVDAYAAQYGLPRDLLHAHMLVESRFDPSAISGAGARGLLQLMPATARRVAESIGEESDEARLLNPAFNIELGARYLSRLITHFEGQLPPAIGAYNAGRGNVQRWLLESPSGLEAWVEAIPISQTRNYVRRVLTHWARYRYLRDPNDWEPPLPDSLHAPAPEATGADGDEGAPDGEAEDDAYAED